MTDRNCRRLDLTGELQDRIAAVERAIADHVPGAESAPVVELPKLDLADAVLKAVAAQRAQRIARLPAKAPVIGVGLPRKRRRA